MILTESVRHISLHVLTDGRGEILKYLAKMTFGFALALFLCPPELGESYE